MKENGIYTIQPKEGELKEGQRKSMIGYRGETISENEGGASETHL